MPEEQVPTRLGNYHQLQLSGKGGFARVYVGKHITLGTLAAIKVLRPKYAGNEEKVADFYNEARLAARLKHRHIVRVLDCDQDEDFHFFVMDYALNGLLRQYCEQGKLLSPALVIKYIKQTASALQFVHNQGYIHRDVKPENLLLDAQGNILLCDFGIAIPIPTSQHEHIKDVGGTVGYMAPEQIRRKPVPASDQYSLAIVTYELFAGKCPFRGTSTEIAYQHKHIHPPSLRAMVPGISPAIDHVVSKALSKDPYMRYPNIMAFATALEHAYVEGPTTLRHHPVNIHAQPSPTRRLPVDVQSRPVASHRLSMDLQSAPLPTNQSSATIHSEPLRRNRAGSTMPLQPGKVRQPAPLMRQPVQPQQHQRPRLPSARILDALELVGRVTAGISISLGMGIAMFMVGVGHDLALSLSAFILFIMLDILLLDGWAAMLVPSIMLALSVVAGILFCSLTFFWISLLFMCIVMVISVSVSKLRRDHN